ncbi:putative lipoprotein [Synechococcus sp. A18-25c]|uniref:hypothetical protein n=1 Tax=Synechococcus sp. A18-25c TaxID=1866938 RepID=UPI001645D911|nr:hypothetical protein [Synechococcus sp. A18-25c]QNJ20680.1 putative lipoprotein [Synechococcus sp. A18-25c]
MSKTTVLALGGALLLFTGCATVTKAPPQAEFSSLAAEPEPVVEEEVVAPDTTIKGSFVNVTYLLDAPPKTTTGEATWNPDTNTVTYYDQFTEGNYKGYISNYQCQGRFHFEIKNGTPKKTWLACDTKMVDGKPVSTTVTYPEDGFFSSKVTFKF